MPLVVLLLAKPSQMFYYIYYSLLISVKMCPCILLWPSGYLYIFTCSDLVLNVLPWHECRQFLMWNLWQNTDKQIKVKKNLENLHFSNGNIWMWVMDHFTLTILKKIVRFFFSLNAVKKFIFYHRSTNQGEVKCCHRRQLEILKPWWSKRSGKVRMWGWKASSENHSAVSEGPVGAVGSGPAEVADVERYLVLGANAS